MQLAQKEYELLLRLARDPERVVTKAELLQEVWGYRAGARTRTLDSHASRLRRKLRELGGDGLVENVWGVGYRLLGSSPRSDGRRVDERHRLSSSDGDRAGHDEECDGVRDDERQVVTGDAVRHPQPEADQQHGVSP